jgi:hypothetical protein
MKLSAVDYMALMICGVLFFTGSCEKKEPPITTQTDLTPPRTALTWEYKLVTLHAPTHERTGANALATNEIIVDEKKLTELGNDGWELAGSWLETETSYPNLGDAKYITGLQPNIRPARAVLLFKRAPR